MQGEEACVLLREIQMVWGGSGPAGSWEGTEAAGVQGQAFQHFRVGKQLSQTRLGHGMGFLGPFEIRELSTK